jgi:hypothetical protein
VYRMHMLLPESFTIRGADGSSKEDIWTGSTALSGARAVMVSHTGYAIHRHPVHMWFNQSINVTSVAMKFIENSCWLSAAD